MGWDRFRANWVESHLRHLPRWRALPDDLPVSEHVRAPRVILWVTMGMEVVPLDLKILWRASELRFEFGLMMDGSLMASTALEAGLEVMATADKDFQSVRELSVAMPGDLRKRP